MRCKSLFVVAAVLAATIGISGAAGADPAAPVASDNRNNAAVFDYWTADRIASAVPRDLVIAENGLGYLKGANGELTPHGHNISAPIPQVRALPMVGAQEPPQASGAEPMLVTFSDMSPAEGETVTSPATFSVNVTGGNVRAVDMYVGPPGNPQANKFAMSYMGEGVWQQRLTMPDANWEWLAVAKERRGGGNTPSGVVGFTVNSGGGGGGGGDTGENPCEGPNSGAAFVVDDRWCDGGAVQTAAGRILFTMGGFEYLCSGTAVTDGTTGRSIILTAAHCVYDDVAKAFATNVTFIPSQDDGGTDASDDSCTNDVLGCWAVDHGIVDINWVDRRFPDNIPWDYGYYVVSDTGAHSGTEVSSSALDQAAGSLTVDFSAPILGESATALGYSGKDDPYFHYCQESLSTDGPSNYWLGSCGLEGGSSGGPWMQPVDGGNGVIISINSYGYVDSTGASLPGMAGPKLHNNSAALLFHAAKGSDLASADSGFVIDPAADSPPSVSLVSPTDGSVVSGVVTIEANASDDEGVASVEFFADGVSLGSDVSAPYTVDWDSTQAADGQAPISARVADSAGQTRTTSVTVLVDNIPDTLVHVGGLDASTTSLRGGKWSATVTVTVVDSTSSPVEGVSVSGDWNAGDAGSVSCTTGASGQCQVESGNLNKRTSSVKFSVAGLTGDGLTYDPSSNIISEITAFKP